MAAHIVEIRDYQPKAITNYGIRYKEPAKVIVLPVVRIERTQDGPADGPGLRRRRILELKRKVELFRELEARRAENSGE